jgi:alkylhydroperoxidase family enzyme
MIKHPRFFEPWAQLGSRFRGGQLPEHDKELVTLRVAHLMASPYEWAHHTRSAKIAGVTEEEIVRVQTGPDAWEGSTAAKIRAVDEIHRDHRISDATWAEIAAEYDEQQMLELILLVGFYSMTAWVLNSVQIVVDDWLPEPSPPLTPNVAIESAGENA